MVGNRQEPLGASAPGCKELGEQAEGEGRRHLPHLQKQLLDTGDSPSLIKYPPVVKADGFVRRKTARHGGNYGRHGAPLPVGWDPQGGLHPQMYLAGFGTWASASITPHRVSGQTPRKAERRSLQIHSAYTRFWKDLRPRILCFPSTADFFITKMKISGAYIMQPFGHSKARQICTGVTEKQPLGWDVSAQDVLLK